MKKTLVSVVLLVAFCSICFAKAPTPPPNKSPKFKKQMTQLKNKITKYESKTQYYQNTAAKYQKANKTKIAKEYMNLAEANNKLVQGLNTMCKSKEAFILAQQKVLDEGTAFAGKDKGNAAMFPHKNTTIDNRIKALNECIEMYDKQGTLTTKDGSYTQGVDYSALGKAAKEQVIGLETVNSAQKEMKAIRTKISSLKKKNNKTVSK